jgi:ADP-ribose pyrophosphatase YjhB (NUDIX family)
MLLNAYRAGGCFSLLWDLADPSSDHVYGLAIMTSTLDYVRRLLALAQTGLHFGKEEYDRERYREVAQIAAELLALESNHDAKDLLSRWQADDGYITPKMDVRGACFRADKRVLLVRERIDGKWTLPGGWADVNDSPSCAIEKEIEQESGFSARAVKVAALYDRSKHHPPYLFHAWKVFFICDITGGAPRVSNETDAVDFFDVNDLPELSIGRSTAAQIRRMLEHHLDRTLPTDFD